MARTPSEKGFSAGLKAFAKKLKRRAAGRICQDCTYFSTHFKDCNYHWDGDFLVTLYYADAVACLHFEDRCIDV
jgi:hypothetical protein